MSIRETLNRLYARRTFGVKLGLEVELALLEELENPQNDLQVIHIAGTNGKGSVCAMIDSILSESGLITGMYTSPHLVQFQERFRINGKLIIDTELNHVLERVESAANTVAQRMGQEPTFFECTTALAFLAFKLHKVDIAIIETGLGGRLDATNVVTPIASVITRLGIDHIQHLGTNLSAIAREKSGIIKPRRTVICGPQNPTAMSVIELTAKKRCAPITRVEEVISITLKERNLDGQKVSVESPGINYCTIHLPLHGVHQLENLAISVATIEALEQQGFMNITPDTLKSGIKKVNWPGRCQLIKRNPKIILDGAHNVSSATQLTKTLQYLVGKSSIGLICGFSENKDIREFFNCLPKTIRKAWFVELSNSRSTSFGTIRKAAISQPWEKIDTSLSEALTEASTWAMKKNGAICITGSLYLVGEFLTLENQGVVSK